MVEAMAGYGTPQEQMRHGILNPKTGNPIARKTLAEHFRRELDLGILRANTNVAKTLYGLAVGHDAEYDTKNNCIREEQKPDKGACIWWTKARMGWTERIIQEHTGDADLALIIRGARKRIEEPKNGGE